MIQNNMIVKVDRVSYNVDYSYENIKTDEACPWHGQDGKWRNKRIILSISDALNQETKSLVYKDETPLLWNKIVAELQRIESIPFCDLCSLEKN